MFLIHFTESCKLNPTFIKIIADPCYRMRQLHRTSHSYPTTLFNSLLSLNLKYFQYFLFVILLSSLPTVSPLTAAFLRRPVRVPRTLNLTVLRMSSKTTVYEGVTLGPELTNDDLKSLNNYGEHR